jgi:hypothetical protein
MRPASHNRPPSDYVTLHGLHDLQGNRLESKESLPASPSAKNNLSRVMAAIHSFGRRG